MKNDPDLKITETKKRLPPHPKLTRFKVVKDGTNRKSRKDFPTAWLCEEHNGHDYDWLFSADTDHKDSVDSYNRMLKARDTDKANGGMGEVLGQSRLVPERSTDKKPWFAWTWQPATGICATETNQDNITDIFASTPKHKPFSFGGDE